MESESGLFDRGQAWQFLVDFPWGGIFTWRVGPHLGSVVS